MSDITDRMICEFVDELEPLYPSFLTEAVGMTDTAMTKAMYYQFLAENLSVEEIPDVEALSRIRREILRRHQLIVNNIVRMLMETLKKG